MEVEMKNGLTGGLIAIHSDAVAIIIDALVLGYLPGGQEQFTDIINIVACHLIDRCHVLARNNQNVRWRLGVDVPKCDDILRLKHNVCRYLARGNLAKQTI
jgi:hypothetical protein